MARGALSQECDGRRELSRAELWGSRLIAKSPSLCSAMNATTTSQCCAGAWMTGTLGGLLLAVASLCAIVSSATAQRNQQTLLSEIQARQKAIELLISWQWGRTKAQALTRLMRSVIDAGQPPMLGFSRRKSWGSCQHPHLTGLGLGPPPILPSILCWVALIRIVRRPNSASA